MKSKLTRFCFLLSLGASVFSVAGCGRQVGNIKHYLLEAGQRSGPAAEPTDAVLLVRTLSVDSAFSGKNLVYRTDEHQYEFDFYNRFLASPSAMVTAKTLNWMAASGLCKSVLDSESRLDPTHIIEGNVIAMHGDFRDKASPKAVLEMRISLLKTRAAEEPLAVFAKTYKSSLPLESNDPESLVASLDRCLDEILRDLEKDLAEKLP